MKKYSVKLVVALMRLLSKLPLRFHYAVSDIFSWIALHIFGYREDVVTVNIARSFPDKKYSELKEIKKQFYRHFGEIFAETVKFSGCTDYQKLRKADLCETVFTPELAQAYDKGNGMMILTSHCGNWELLGGWFGYLPEGFTPAIREDKVRVVYKKLSNSFWNEVFAINRCAPLLSKGFNGYIDSTRILRHALQHKNDKLVYVFPTDQFPYKEATRHEIPDFMHQKTYAMTGGASLAHKLGMSVVYLRFESVRRGHYRMSYETICDNASEMDPGEIMEKYYALLQKDIEAQPWNYLWSHKRWKQ